MLHKDSHKNNFMNMTLGSNSKVLTKTGFFSLRGEELGSKGLAGQIF